MSKDKALPIAIFLFVMFAISMAIGDLTIAAVLIMSAVIVLILERGN